MWILIAMSLTFSDACSKNNGVLIQATYNEKEINGCSYVKNGKSIMQWEDGRKTEYTVCPAELDKYGKKITKATGRVF